MMKGWVITTTCEAMRQEKSGVILTRHYKKAERMRRVSVLHELSSGIEFTTIAKLLILQRADRSCVSYDVIMETLRLHSDALGGIWEL